jgi:methylenetetrahydrofolate reductase (NADPH)
LIKETRKVDNDEDLRQIGIEWCIAQSKDLKEKGVPCLHYYTMSDAMTIKKICSQVV